MSETELEISDMIQDALLSAMAVERNRCTAILERYLKNTSNVQMREMLLALLAEMGDAS